MSWTCKNLDTYMGKVVGNGQCVRLLQIAAGLPHTSKWRRGAKVRDVKDIEPGTAAATFDADGSYGNHTDGRSHGCFVMAVAANGLIVIDQWKGQPVHERLIRFRKDGRPVNRGDFFHVIEGDTDTIG